MRGILLVGAVALSAGLASPAQAQRVAADIQIGTGPVQARVVVRPDRSRHGHDHVVVRRHPRRVVVVERHAPRVIVVERLPYRRYRSERWLRRHGYRPVLVYFDDHRYFDRPYADRDRGRHARLREVILWERDGRHYRVDGAEYTSSYTGDRYWVDDD